MSCIKKMAKSTIKKNSFYKALGMKNFTIFGPLERNKYSVAIFLLKKNPKIVPSFKSKVSI
jgi:hypothetical protein